MVIEKNRHMKELIELFHAEEPVTAEQLALSTDSSVRTIKNDVKYLNEELKEEDGCEIYSHKGKGYSIIIHDEQKAESLHYRLTVLNALFGYRSIIDTSRWLFIVQTLLTHHEIKKDKLCETLYLSESGIAPHLARACTFLESFGLQVHSNAVQGLFIQGKEQDIRSCLVEVASSSYHEIELLYSVPEFEKMIYPDIHTYQDVRHAFLKVLRESKMSVTDIASKRLATHLCLVKERSRLGFLPEIEQSLQEELVETYEYTLAKEVFQDSVIHDYLGNQEEIEIINFARLLIVNRDIDLQSQKDMETILPRYIIASQKVMKKVWNVLKKDSAYVSIFNMDIMQRYETDFESLVLQLYLKYYFDRLTKQRLVTYIESEEQLLSPVAKEIARVFTECLQQGFCQQILSSETLAIASLIDLVLKNVKYQYSRLHLALSSMQGRVVGKNLRQGIMNKYAHYVSEIDVYDLYEMRRVNFEDYDAILIHGEDKLYFNYPCKFVAYEALDTRIDNSNEVLFDELFIDGYSKNILHRMKDIMNVYKDVHVESLQAFFTLISYKYARSDEDRRFLYAHLTERESILSCIYSNGIGVIILDDDHTGKEYFDIYKLDHGMINDNEYMAKYMIVMCVDSHRPVQDIKEINRLIQAEIHSQDTLDTLLDNKDSLDETWRKVMKNQFLNS